MNVFRYILAMTLGIVLTFSAQYADRRWLSPERRHAAWNTASWGSALYAFGPLSMIGWVWVTRSRVRVWWRESPALCVLKSVGLLVVGAVASGIVLFAIARIDDLVAWLSGTE